MTTRKVEIFIAGCAVCNETVDTVRRVSCASCAIDVLDMHVPEVAARAKQLGVRQVPAVVVDGKLLACCTAGPTEADLRAAGVGSPM